MKGFINITLQTGFFRLMPIDKIYSVFELKNGNAFIETQPDKRSGYGFETLESYAEVVAKIEEATK